VTAPSNLLEGLRRRWRAEARARGDRAAVTAFSDPDDMPDDPAAVLAELRNEREEPIGNPWRRSA